MQLLQYFKELSLLPTNAAELKGLILQLAVQGKLTAKWRDENPDAEPASVLLERIKKEKARLVKEGKIKKEKKLPEIGEDEKPFELPEGWAWCRLGDISKQITDGEHQTPPRIESGRMLLSAKNVRDGFINYENCQYISEEHYQKSISRCHPERGDLLIVSVGGTIGRVSAISEDAPFALVRSVALIKPLVYNNAYLRWVMNSPLLQNIIQNKKRGGAQPCLYLSEIKKFPFPLPPLAEQKAIVEIVDRLLAEVEQLQQLTQVRVRLKEDFAASALNRLAQGSQTETTQEWKFLREHFRTFFTEGANVQKLRESILQLAVQGKLTANWREEHPDTEPASALLKRIQAEKAKLVKEGKIKKEKKLPEIGEDEKPFELPEGWKWCRLDHILEINGGVTKGKKRQTQMVNTPYLRVANVQRGALDLELVKEILVSLPDYEKYQLEFEDLLMIEGGDADKVGRCAIWKNEIPGCIYQNHVFRARAFLKEKLEKTFLMRLINSPSTRAYFLKCAKQTTNLASINKTQIRNTPVGLPPLAEQKAIVAQVDALMALCDRLEASLGKQQSVQEDWMTSSLREVFAGP